MAANQTILVVGGGIAGITAAVEAAEMGYEVHVVERGPSLGGRVARFGQYFPKLCPPACGLELNLRRLVRSRTVRVHALTEPVRIDGELGDLEVTLRTRPRFVTEDCTGCGACVEVCPAERSDDFDYGLTTTRAIYAPREPALPATYVVDRRACPPGCAACVSACRYGAIDLDLEPRETIIRVGAVVVATGWQPYDAGRLAHLGAGLEPDVITNVVMERLAAPSGPTGGRVLRPSDSRAPARVAFVQCAGSRDRNHLAYCSGVCCLASLKQATYVRSQAPEAEIFLFCIDVRAPGRNEDFFAEVARDARLHVRRGLVARITRDGDGRLRVEAEDAETGRKTAEAVDLVVLATGMQPSLASSDEGASSRIHGVAVDREGFVRAGGAAKGIFAAGCARAPVDVAAAVQDATAATLRAIQTVGRRVR
jgi:quinone-modifying oxidoreductase subunit QmoA